MWLLNRCIGNVNKLTLTNYDECVTSNSEKTLKNLKNLLCKLLLSEITQA